MELRGLENKKVFYKFTGNFLEIKKVKSMQHLSIHN